MVKAMSLRVANCVSEEVFGSSQDRIREMIAVVKKTGLDLDELDSLPGSPHGINTVTLTSEEIVRRDRLVSSVLQRFRKVLTPPVPPDLEQCIRRKDQCDWLPWEAEVMEKVGTWRSEIERIEPEIVAELSAAVRAIHGS